MKILSPFDGISCARVALERAGIPVELYYASEVDKYAIQIAQKNYPNTIQLGSIVGLTPPLNIDLLIGGSPCQDLSIAKKNREGLSGKRSGLFWEYVRVLKEVKPKYFILENVASMPKEARGTITKELGVEPIMINANLVSAQNRKRLFWFGQIRERLYFTEVFCYDCLYENSRIQKETLRKGESKILGETQSRHNSLQGVSEAIPANDSQGNDKNLFVGMPDRKQETQRPKERQGKESNIPEKVYAETPSEAIGVSKEISSISNREAENEGSGCTTSQENHKSDEDSLSSGTNGDKEENNARGGYGDTGNEKDMCCVRCSKRLDDRPYKSFISGWDKRFEQPTSSLSEVQFNEARQNNGRVYDVYQMNVKLPDDRGILLKDILETGDTERLKSYCIDANYFKGGKIGGTHQSSKRNYTIRIGQFNSGGQGDRVYSPEGKSVGLSALGGGRGAKMELYAVAQRGRNIVNGKRKDILGAKTEQRIEIGGSEKAHTVTSVFKDSMIMKDTIIRKFTPVECERLQSLPDNYTEGISNTQRYKTLGNAMNVEVITHILKSIVN